MMLVSVIIIMILPGIIAACLHCKLHGLMHKIKVLGYFITYTIGINILIAGILWLVGIQKFNLKQTNDLKSVLLSYICTSRALYHSSQ